MTALLAIALGVVFGRENEIQESIRRPGGVSGSVSTVCRLLGE